MNAAFFDLYDKQHLLKCSLAKLVFVELFYLDDIMNKSKVGRLLCPQKLSKKRFSLSMSWKLELKYFYGN